MSKIRKSFGKRVKELRKAKNISQEELGERAGLHYTYIGGVERGERNISLESMGKIASGLDVNIGELFPFVSRKGKIPETDSLRNEIVNMLYECDRKALKLIAKVIKEIKDSSEAKE
jgi:transcriptional regulator with XRE-family HTH domain